MEAKKKPTPEELAYAALKEPFSPNVIHWRLGATNVKKVRSEKGDQYAKPTKGVPLAYLNARDVMKRLDDVIGNYNWSDSYPFAGCCELSLRVNGEWITKSDGAGETEIEGEKGQYSDAFKRAAVKFGVGRYLYYLTNEWVDLDKWGKFTTPALPAWALPATKAEPIAGKERIDIAFEALQKGYEQSLESKSLTEFNKTYREAQRIFTVDNLEVPVDVEARRNELRDTILETLAA